jgi:hypothetical protein
MIRGEKEREPDRGRVAMEAMQEGSLEKKKKLKKNELESVVPGNTQWRRTRRACGNRKRRA